MNESKNNTSNLSEKSNPSTLYKLIVLYMLSRVSHPLTKTQVSDFILEKDYTSYLNLQTIFAQLSEAGLISQKKYRNRTQLSLTEDGISMLSMFGNELTGEIKNDIDDFLKRNSHEFRQAVSVTCDYNKISSSGGDGYQADLCVTENGSALLSLSLSLPTEEMAEQVCCNWEQRCGDVYSAVMEILLKD